MTSRPIGVVAEDSTDCNAIQAIVVRLLGKHVGVKKRSGKGCSRLKKKLSPTLRDLASSDCRAVIVVHDLDRDPNGRLNNESELRAELSKLAAEECNIPTCICIPVEELEAWFWSDQAVLDLVARARGKAKARPNPHLLKSPKEALIELSVGANAKPRYSTNDNEALAKALNFEVCAKACPSFAALLDFVMNA